MLSCIYIYFYFINVEKSSDVVVGLLGLDPGGQCSLPL